jgi:hypothetical protein
MIEQTVLDQIVSVISSLGFPIFVAVYLLFRTDKVLREVRDAVRELVVVLKAQEG